LHRDDTSFLAWPFVLLMAIVDWYETSRVRRLVTFFGPEKSLARRRARERRIMDRWDGIQREGAARATKRDHPESH
jgi:hypothetical protein